MVESKPFLPGERLSVAREMKRNVKGFREVSRELALARRMVEQQEQMRKDSTKDKVIQTSFYKSVVVSHSVLSCLFLIYFIFMNFYDVFYSYFIC